jgi:hypothetical protein
MRENDEDMIKNKKEVNMEYNKRRSNRTIGYRSRRYHSNSVVKSVKGQQVICPKFFCERLVVWDHSNI